MRRRHGATQWFLLSAAHAEHAQVSIVQLLKDVRVGDVMSRDCIRVDPSVNLQTIVDEHLLRSGRRCLRCPRDPARAMGRDDGGRGDAASGQFAR